MTVSASSATTAPGPWRSHSRTDALLERRWLGLTQRVSKSESLRHFIHHAKKSRMQLVGVATVHEPHFIVKIIAVYGIHRWDRRKSDTGKHRVLVVACADCAHYNSSLCHYFMPKSHRERRGSRSQMATWTTRSICGMHDPSPDFYCFRARNSEFMEHCRESLCPKDSLGDTHWAVRYQAIDPHTADKPRTIICKDMMGMEVNRISVEEAAVTADKLRPAAVVEQHGPTKRPDAGEPAG